MDIATQKELVALTTAFYAAQAQSFSDTRHAPWPGWERCAGLIGTHCMGDELRILDVGCGNMRFEKYLSEALSQRSLVFETVDNCETLIPKDLPVAQITHHECDVIGALIDGACQVDPRESSESSSSWGVKIAPVDAVCAFGVMHHVPSEQNRIALLRALLNSTRPWGFAIVSLWRFMEVPALADKARETLGFAKADENLPADLRDQLDGLAAQNDYLLGWQNISGAYRYCHSFCDADIDVLIASVADKAKLIERFCADGRTSSANEYLIFQRVN